MTRSGGRQVDDVLAQLRAAVHPLAAEAVPVVKCADRVLATTVVASVDVPGFDRAAMDGYAVRGADTAAASPAQPAVLTLVGESLPGRTCAREVGPGECVRITTGAPLPVGADAVAILEVCQELGRSVRVGDVFETGRHVSPRGEDMRAGDPVLEPGRRLRPQDAGLLASLGVHPVRCIRRPRVAILATGSELIPPGELPRGGRIVDSNSVVVAGLVARDGGVAAGVERPGDQCDSMRRAMSRADVDVLLISGGSSVGREDHAAELLAELGEVDFHGVALRPAAPAGGGRIGATRVFLLPGNPVSCLCAYEFFAGPTIRRLGGRPWAWPHRRMRAPLCEEIVSARGRTDYVRVELAGASVRPLATGGAGVLSSTVRAAGVVVVPADREGAAVGDEVEVLLYDG